MTALCVGSLDWRGEDGDPVKRRRREKRVRRERRERTSKGRGERREVERGKGDPVGQRDTGEEQRGSSRVRRRVREWRRRLSAVDRSRGWTGSFAVRHKEGRRRRSEQRLRDRAALQDRDGYL